MDVLTTVLLLLVLAAVVEWRFHVREKLWPAKALPGPTVRIGPHVFAVELAADPASRARGLSGRWSLAPERGMLFAYPADQSPDESGFWMKDCHIDLDIAFISGDRRVVTILTMKAEPPDTPDSQLPWYRPTAPAQFALEVPAGEFRRRSIAVGDKVEFSPQVEEAVRTAR